jgi:hypothetical protein
MSSASLIGHPVTVIAKLALTAVIASATTASALVSEGVHRVAVLGDTPPALAVSFGAHGFNHPAMNLAPGDAVWRTITLTNRGSNTLSIVAIAAAAQTTGGTANAQLQLRVDRCSQRWLLGTNGLRCPGRLQLLSRWTGLDGHARTLAEVTSLAPGGSAQLRVGARLVSTTPTSAPATIRYAFTAA